MIIVKNEKYLAYEQDIRELLNAFFPGEELSGKETGEAPSFVIDIDRITDPLSLSGVRFEEKSVIKKAVYETVSGETGKTLPWGTLTGIKPVKLADKLLREEGLSSPEAFRAIKERYLVSNEKAKLMLFIAEKENGLVSMLPARGYSLYAGIPFCPTRCLYCSFTSNPLSVMGKHTGEYLDALEKELESAVLCAKEMNGQEKLTPSTIYIGGGTPTALTAGELSRLLSMIDRFVERKGLLEYTCESGRPDSITGEKLAVLKDHGIERISINPQTMNQKTLDLIGRRHTVKETIDAFSLARSMGFSNINMDLIMGLPGETKEDVAVTLSEVEKLSPDNLTVHALAVKRAARLSTDHDPWKEYQRAEGKEAEEMTAMGAESARRMGMEPYYLYRQKNMAGNQENIGYARAGKESLYNIIMMEGKQTVLGFGAGSTTRLLSEEYDRMENIKDLSQYLLRVSELLAKKEAFYRKTGVFRTTV